MFYKFRNFFVFNIYSFCAYVFIIVGIDFIGNGMLRDSFVTT